jgi:hypothetical protein
LVEHNQAPLYGDLLFLLNLQKSSDRRCLPESKKFTTIKAVRISSEEVFPLSSPGFISLRSESPLFCFPQPEQPIDWNRRKDLRYDDDDRGIFVHEKEVEE